MADNQYKHAVVKHLHQAWEQISPELSRAEGLQGMMIRSVVGSLDVDDLFRQLDGYEKGVSILESRVMAAAEDIRAEGNNGEDEDAD